MDLDTDKFDDAVLALLALGLHDGRRAWKGFDWDALDRLHSKGYISDPKGKAKSVEFTDEAPARAERLLAALFGRPTGPGAATDRRPRSQLPRRPGGRAAVSPAPVGRPGPVPPAGPEPHRPAGGRTPHVRHAAVSALVDERDRSLPAGFDGQGAGRRRCS